MTDRYQLATAHLRVRLRSLNRALRAAADRQTARAAKLTRPDLAAYCVTAEQAGLLLDRVDEVAEQLPGTAECPGVPVSTVERAAERAVRRLAAADGVRLPLDELSSRYQLDRAEQDALLLAAAPELDRSYERVFAYLMDDLNRRAPSVELMVAVLSGTAAEALAVRRLLGPAGRLRRYGLLRLAGSADVELSAPLWTAPGLFDLLIGAGGEPALVGHDPGEVSVPAGFVVPPQLDPDRLARLGRALDAGQLDLVGVWGVTRPVQRDAALALAGHAGRPLRVLPVAEPDGEQLAAARTAATLGALLWVPADGLGDGPAGTAALDLLERSRIPTVLSGVTPWRPAALLAARGYGELEVPPADYGQRRQTWSAALPGLDRALVDDLAVRYQMSGEQLRAVASVAGAGARFAGNGRPAPLAEHVPGAVAMVTRGHGTGYARTITPRRTIEDLVLPEEQYRHLLEIEAAFRAWPRVAEAWGFGRTAGDTGVKVLFTGEPGTGKTLSAEILAGKLGLDLLKVDLSTVVSKWVGETEKNLESAFQQAEQCQAVLFFDEADSLFGKRGEVKHGTDRYANLEVGYLLQRLEESAALVILASNLRENIDAAFIRRFHFVVNFPRPGPAERRRLWRLAFPPEAPVGSDVDLDVLSRLDMTGAGIASAARSAALAAADSEAATIAMPDIVSGVIRQYQREARLLRASELGRYGYLLGVPAGRRDG
ncbi:MAG: ATP-binding protein [Micromonosporaceae bacterium]|nr:ATP-binding protein [Micromonosporaceae bacterium]